MPSVYCSSCGNKETYPIGKDKPNFCSDCGESFGAAIKIKPKVVKASIDTEEEETFDCNLTRFQIEGVPNKTYAYDESKAQIRARLQRQGHCANFGQVYQSLGATTESYKDVAKRPGEVAALEKLKNESKSSRTPIEIN